MQNHDSLVLNALTQAEGQYKADPDQFKKDVEQEEDRREKLLEKHELSVKNDKDIEELRSKEKKR